MGGGGGGASSFPGGPTDLDALRQRAREIADQTTFDAEVNDRLAQRFASINARDHEKIGRYLDDIVAALKEDIDGVERTLFGGSVAKNTYVEGLSDVDALVVLDRADLKDATPEQVREQFCRSLKAQLSHADVAGVSFGSLAVTVSYHDGTEIQLLPAVQRGERLAISSADGKEWKTIHPRSLARRLSEINKSQGGAAVPALKLAKQVIGLQLPDGERPSGYHVEALAVQAFGDYVGSRNPKAMLTHFFASAARGVLQPIKDVSGQSLHVDDSLGDARSADRHGMSRQLQHIADTMQNSRDVRDWNACWAMHELPADEYRQRRDIIDMMLSAHSVLRDRYERRSTGLTLLILGLSVAATGVAFISGEPQATIGPFTARVQVWVGMLTCLIFFLSILELLVEWRRRAWAHDEAAQRLSDLKATFRRAKREADVVRSDVDLVDAHDHTMDALGALRVRIPESQFNRLKARHWRKVEISKRTSARPQRPPLMHRLDVLREGLGSSPHNKKQAVTPPPETKGDA